MFTIKMDDEYDIKSKWVRPNTELPSAGTRCIVTDGDVMIIATYTGDTGWLFSEISFECAKSFVVQGWMALPKPIKKLVSYEPKIESQN